jgi:hypothetical protein
LEFGGIGGIIRDENSRGGSMNPRQVVILAVGVLFIIGSVLPKPIIERATNKPFDNQLAVRLSLAGVGVIMILALRTVA